MGIYIKGMKMPKNCLYCPMSHWNKLDEITGCEIVNGKKYIDKKDSDYWDSSNRPKWCPLVEIPKHGRLIDADSLMRSYEPKEFCSDMGDAMEILDHAPTVIEGDTE